MLARPIPTAAGLLLLAATGHAQLCATEEAELTAEDVTPAGWFGTAVALSGDTAAVGAPSQTHSAKLSAGAAYVYERGGGATWDEAAKLVAGDPATSGRFGTSVAVDGDTLVVGSVGAELGPIAPGAAYVFVRSGTSWIQEAKLTASDAQHGDDFGASVSVQGDTLVVGAPFDGHTVPDAGSAYVFERSGTTWSETAKLVAGDAGQDDLFGSSLELHGDTVAIGAIGDDTPAGANAGSAYVFVRAGTGWVQQAWLTAGDGGAGELFGSVSLFGDTAAVGARRANHSGLFSPGAAFVFTRSGTTWSEQAKLVADDADNGDQFGVSTSIDGERVLVGALHDSHSGVLLAGSAYTFDRDGTSWNQTLKLTADDPLPQDWFAAAALDGARAIVGAVNGDRAHAFRLSSATVSYCTAGSSSSGCRAALSASGIASAGAASGFQLTASSVEGNRSGLFFFGTNGRKAGPWGNGSSYRCVVPPVSRGGVLSGVGLNGSCDGTFTQDLNARWAAKPNQNPGPGAVVQAQLWYRDPGNTSNRKSSLSDALEFCVGP